MTCKCDSPCTCGKCKPDPNCNMSCLKRFDVALNTRNFEIDLFWRRSNYFLVLNTAIAVGFVSLVSEDERLYALAFCLIGIVVCFVWFKVNLGSKYWQSYWEQRVDEAANNMKVCFFTTKTKEWVEKNLNENKEGKKRDCWEDIYDDLVLKKPSVSKCMTFLSLFFLVVWVVVLVGSIISFVM